MRTLVFALTLAFVVALTATAPGAADLDKGEAIAKGCKCHGSELDGRPADDIFKDLMAFKNGKRFNKLMEQRVAALSEEDLRNVSAYFASK